MKRYTVEVRHARRGERILVTDEDVIEELDDDFVVVAGNDHSFNSAVVVEDERVTQLMAALDVMREDGRYLTPAVKRAMEFLR